MIIDAHVHCDVRFGWVHTPEVLIRVMNEGGIDKACITGLADIPGDDAQAYPRCNTDSEAGSFRADGRECAARQLAFSQGPERLADSSDWQARRAAIEGRGRDLDIRWLRYGCDE